MLTLAQNGDGKELMVFIARLVQDMHNNYYMTMDVE